MPSKKSKGLTQAEMLASITSTVESLGATFQVDPDAELTQFRQGDPLAHDELSKMPDDAIIWVTYRQAGERSYRINGAYRIRKLEGDPVGWFLDDGSSFAADFYPNPRALDGQAVDEDDDGGITCAFVAVKK